MNRKYVAIAAYSIIITIIEFILCRTSDFFKVKNYLAQDSYWYADSGVDYLSIIIILSAVTTILCIIKWCMILPFFVNLYKNQK